MNAATFAINMKGRAQVNLNDSSIKSHSETSFEAAGGRDNSAWLNPFSSDEQFERLQKQWAEQLTAKGAEAAYRVTRMRLEPLWTLVRPLNRTLSRAIEDNYKSKWEQDDRRLQEFER